MCSIAQQGGDGGGREVAEIDKLLSSAHFDNNQHVQAIAGEEQRTAAAQKQITEKQTDVKLLEESTSRCDTSAKELHQRLRRARENSESSKRTSALLDEHITAVQRKLSEAKELREIKRSEKAQKLRHYQQVWERYQQVYSERELAKQLSGVQSIANADMSRAQEVEEEVGKLQESFSRLTTAINERNERAQQQEEAENLAFNSYVIEIAKAYVEKRRLAVSNGQLEECVPPIRAECESLELKKKMVIADMERCEEEGTQSEQQPSNLNQQTPSCSMPVTQPRQSLSLPQTSIQAPASRSFLDAGLSSMPGIDIPVSDIPMSVASSNSAADHGPVPGMLSTVSSSRIAVTEVTQMPASTGDEPEPMHVEDAVSQPVVTCEANMACSFVDAGQSGTDSNHLYNMGPPPSTVSAPTMPKTPQAPSTPRQDRPGAPSPGFGLQKPASPLDSFQYSGRPMFSASGNPGSLASPTASPTPALPFFQAWNSQRSKETPESPHVAATEPDSDPASGFLAIAASLVPASSQDHTANQHGGGLFDSASQRTSSGSINTSSISSSTEDTSSSSTSPSTSSFGMLGSMAASATSPGRDSFSFSFGDGATDLNSSSPSNNSGAFSFSFSGGGGSADSSQSAGFSFGSGGDGTTGDADASSGFSFGTAAAGGGSPQQAGSGFPFAFGAASPPQQNSKSMFSLF